ncbi:DUF6790 family protein [Streptococcus dentiloxodontae]
MVYIISYILSWVIGFIIYFYHPEKGLLTSLLQAHLIFGVGFFGAFNFIGHYLFSERVAKSIGWVSNGFQKEIGLISLGISVSGMYSGFVHNGLESMSLIIILAFFLIGAGIHHITEIINDKNFQLGNTIIIIPDFLIPVTLFLLFLSQ